MRAFHLICIIVIITSIRIDGALTGAIMFADSMNIIDLIISIIASLVIVTPVTCIAICRRMNVLCVDKVKHVSHPSHQSYHSKAAR